MGAPRGAAPTGPGARTRAGRAEERAVGCRARSGPRRSAPASRRDIGATKGAGLRVVNCRRHREMPRPPLPHRATGRGLAAGEPAKQTARGAGLPDRRSHRPAVPGPGRSGSARPAAARSERLRTTVRRRSAPQQAASGQSAAYRSPEACPLKVLPVKSLASHKVLPDVVSPAEAVPAEVLSHDRLPGRIFTRSGAGGPGRGAGAGRARGRLQRRRLPRCDMRA